MFLSWGKGKILNRLAVVQKTCHTIVGIFYFFLIMVERANGQRQAGMFPEKDIDSKKLMRWIAEEK
jgi:hypothetical protein